METDAHQFRPRELTALTRSLPHVSLGDGTAAEITPTPAFSPNHLAKASLVVPSQYDPAPDPSQTINIHGRKHFKLPLKDMPGTSAHAAQSSLLCSHTQLSHTVPQTQSN